MACRLPDDARILSGAQADAPRDRRRRLESDRLRAGRICPRLRRGEGRRRAAGNLYRTRRPLRLNRPVRPESGLFRDRELRRRQMASERCRDERLCRRAVRRLPEDPGQTRNFHVRQSRSDEGLVPYPGTRRGTPSGLRPAAGTGRRRENLPGNHAARRRVPDLRPRARQQPDRGAVARLGDPLFPAAAEQRQS